MATVPPRISQYYLLVSLLLLLLHPASSSSFFFLSTHPVSSTTSSCLLRHSRALIHCLFVPLHLVPAYDWNLNASDLITVLKALYPSSSKKIVGIGHSGGGALLYVSSVSSGNTAQLLMPSRPSHRLRILASALNPTVFTDIIAMEPILLPKIQPGSTPNNSMRDAALRRRTHFKSKDEAFDLWKTKALFAKCDERALRAYAVRVPLICRGSLLAPDFSSQPEPRTPRCQSRPW